MNTCFEYVVGPLRRHRVSANRHLGRALIEWLEASPGTLLLTVVVAGLLAACAPTVQRTGISIATHDRPRFDVAGEKFYSFDATALGLSAWVPASREPWAVIIGLHGMNDYGNAFFPAGAWFAERGVAVYAYDARGFGRSPRRGVWGGQRLMMEDARTAVAVARLLHPRATLAVVGDSMGAATAITTFAAQGAPRIDRLILVAPALWGWSTLRCRCALALWFGAHTVPWWQVSPPRHVAQRIVASDNTAMLRRIGRDPNMIFRTRVDALYGLVNLMETATRQLNALGGDVALLYGAHDQIIPRNSVLHTTRRLPSGSRTAVYANGYHMLLRDLQAEVVYADILSFLADPDTPLPSAAPALSESEVPAASAPGADSCARNSVSA